MIPEFLDTLEFSLSITGPMFVILGLGAWLRRIGTLDEGHRPGRQPWMKEAGAKGANGKALYEEAVLLLKRHGSL